MLFNPKWLWSQRYSDVKEAPLKQDIYGFLAFLERNPTIEYDFTESSECAFGRFSGKSLYSHELNDFHPGLCSVLVESPWIYGEAAKRLRKILPNQEPK